MWKSGIHSSDMARFHSLGAQCQPSNQSLERTRWARSIRFAGQQCWRAAQLQIR